MQQIYRYRSTRTTKQLKIPSVPHILECLEAISEFSRQNKMTLAWVPGHWWSLGNEKADKLATSSATLIGPEPFCGFAKSTINESMKQWMDKESQKCWNNSPCRRQAKRFIERLSQKFTANQLQLNRETIKIIAGLLTEHCICVLLNWWKRNYVNSVKYKKKTAELILCRCEGLDSFRFLQIGSEKLTDNSYAEEPLSKLWTLIKRKKLDKSL